MTGLSPTSLRESRFPFLKHWSEGTTLSAQVFLDDHPFLVMSNDIFLLCRLLSKNICYNKPMQFRVKPCNSELHFFQLQRPLLPVTHSSSFLQLLQEVTWTLLWFPPDPDPSSPNELSGTFRLKWSSRTGLRLPCAFLLAYSRSRMQRVTGRTEEQISLLLSSTPKMHLQLHWQLSNYKTPYFW